MRYSLLSVNNLLDDGFLSNGRFNLVAFHDELLKDGCMPLGIMERKMINWSEKQK